MTTATRQNGAMWMALGSGSEPIYPPHASLGYGAFGQRELEGIKYVGGVSDPDDEKNDLSRIADKYPQVLVPAKAGDVVFFNGHILHRSKKNWTEDRYRRSFVSHYCNARSFTQWGGDRGPADDRGPDHGHDQRRAYPGARRHAPAVRPAQVRHALRRPALPG